MRERSRIARTLGLVTVLSALLLLVGCSYHEAVSKLSPQEQAEFRAHSKLMSPGHVRAYLAKPTPEARSAYLEEIGSAQRFAALAPEDRELVLAGDVRPGMSAEALRFLWGHPYYTKGYTGHYEYWYYFGSPMELVDASALLNESNTVVKVYLVDGRVKWWLETIPSTNDDSGDKRDLFLR